MGGCVGCGQSDVTLRANAPFRFDEPIVAPDEVETKVYDFLGSFHVVISDIPTVLANEVFDDDHVTCRRQIVIGNGLHGHFERDLDGVGGGSGGRHGDVLSERREGAFLTSSVIRYRRKTLIILACKRYFVKRIVRNAADRPSLVVAISARLRSSIRKRPTAGTIGLFRGLYPHACPRNVSYNARKDRSPAEGLAD
jgi:hypothetical protein